MSSLFSTQLESQESGTKASLAGSFAKNTMIMQNFGPHETRGGKQVLVARIMDIYKGFQSNQSGIPEFPGYQPPSTPMLWALSNSYWLEVASTCLVEKATTAAVRGAQWALWEFGSPAPGENHPDFWILSWKMILTVFRDIQWWLQLFLGEKLVVPNFSPKANSTVKPTVLGHCSVSVGVQDRSQSFAQWPTLLVHKEVLKLTPNCAQSLQLQKKLFYCQLWKSNCTHK